MKKEKDEVRGHAFDGIEEYDNDLPRWWLNIFWITTIFGVVYAGYVHLGFKVEDHKALEMALAEIEEKKIESAPTLSEEFLLSLAGDEAVVAKGKETFASKCVACHADKGQGLIGPNLTDNFWIHGSELLQIRQVIVKGVPEKGMIPWEAMLTNDQINEVVAFIHSIRNTNVEGGKAPEGTEG